MVYKLTKRYLNRRRLYYYTIQSAILFGVILVLTKALFPYFPHSKTNYNNLEHFRSSRDVRHYLDNIKLLIEPSSLPCANVEEVEVITLVFTSPSRVGFREAIRNSWGRKLATYFIMGLDDSQPDQLLIENYIEAKEFDDLIVYEYVDHYNNLTIKSMLMLQWTLDRCPQAEFLFKVDDDVLVNPWTLKQVIKDNIDAKLVGHVVTNAVPYRHPDERWYLPEWLYPNDTIPAYLTGPSYLINGEYIKPLLRASYKVPMINLEDVYLTYLVVSKLKLRLTNDDRITNRRTKWRLPPSSCEYWSLATQHSFEPKELSKVWRDLKYIAHEYKHGNKVCESFLRSLYVKVNKLMV